MNTFEITVQRRLADGWPVIVTHSADDGSLPLRAEGILQVDLAELLAETIDAEAYGTLLGRALFRDNVRDAFSIARGATRDADALHVLLTVEDPELRTLYWQRLCAPVNRRWAFLALDPQVAFSQYLPSVSDLHFSSFGRRDLRALVVVANPANLDEYDLDSFDADGTIASVTSALGEIPADVLALGDGFAGPPTLDAMAERITAQRYTLLHVVCHGRVLRGETVLYLADAADAVAPVTATRFIERLAQLGATRELPHLAYLAMSESASPTAEGALGGLAQRLVRDLGMPAVVAMTDRVTLATAEALASAFYRRLRESGEVDRALVEASAGLSDRFDSTVPALFSRLGGRPLFSDTVGDRPLTSAEIEAALDRLAVLMPDRAPVLLDRFAEAAGLIRHGIVTDAADLAPDARGRHEDALAEIGQLCLEATDLSFAALATGHEPPFYDDRQPFRGLYPFRADDRAFFFGREALIVRLVERVTEHPFLAVLGPSGSGKSSLVLAGLLPALGGSAVSLTPGADPPAQLEATLDGADPAAVVVVDQFEELFTLCRDEARRTRFIAQVLDISSQHRVVVTMRADFWGECAPYADLRAAMQAHQELIGPMDAFELRRAIDLQAASVGLRFEADLAQTVLDEVQGEPGAMPLLQHALLELWKRRHGRWLRTDEYRALGGVRQAIAHAADDMYLTLAPDDQERVRGIFLRLTRLDGLGPEAASGRETRVRASTDELVPVGGDLGRTKALIARLADAHLVVTSVNTVSGRDEVEVAHEALIRYWPRMRTWLDQDRAELRFRAGITNAAQEWDSAARSDDLLVHRGARLDDAVRLSGRPGALNALEEAYIEAARAQQRFELEQRRSLADLRSRHGSPDSHVPVEVADRPKEVEVPKPTHPPKARVRGRVQPPRRTSVFVSYSHADHRWLERLQVHMKPLVRDATLELWDDTRIKAGADWRSEIARAMESAKVAVLLISADFLASDFIARDELPVLLQAAQQDGLVVIVLILSPSQYAAVPALARFQAVNQPSRPLARLDKWQQDEEFVKAVDAIKLALAVPDPARRPPGALADANR